MRTAETLEAMQPVKLHPTAASRVPPGLGWPGFDLGARSPGIVHLGPGGFHRAHMARYTHDLMNGQPEALSWAIVDVGLLPGDRKVVQALTPQAGLYTLLERENRAETATVIGSICELLFAGGSSSTALEAIDRPGVRLVSLTITESGYCLDTAARRLDTSLEIIAHDLTHPTQPRSTIGVIAEALRRRMVADRPAFTALSCDNIQANGVVLKRAVLDFAGLVSPPLASWIERHGRFPSTMVDRITPVTTPQDVEAFAERYGVQDNWPVVSEAFRQWVIEDDFADGRPAWEQVGAQFVTDVTPYELMKLRLLNASHLAVAALGELAGCVYVHETMRDVGLLRYMRALMERETAPTLPPVPGMDLCAYQDELVRRFANEAIRDTVERVNTDAPLNVLLDPLRDRLARGEAVDLLALALAARMRRLQLAHEQGRQIAIKHDAAQPLRVAAAQGVADPRPFLFVRGVFGDLGKSDRLAQTVERWLGRLRHEGVAGSLAQAGV